MKMDIDLDQSFSAERVVAQHCAELTRRSVSPEERSEHIDYWRSRIADELANGFSDLVPSSKVQATLEGPQLQSGEKVLGSIGRLAANCLLRCGHDDILVLFSVAMSDAIALTDLSFGGSGMASGDLPEKLPQSATLLVDQIGELLAQGIADQLGNSDRESGQVVVRSENASRLAPFSRAETCAVFTVTLHSSDERRWSGTLVMPEAMIDNLIEQSAAQAVPETTGASPSNDQIFKAIPFALTARLAEFDLTVGALQALTPGDEIPLRVPSEISMHIADQLFARGTVGTSGDRLAIRLSGLQKGSLVQ